MCLFTIIYRQIYKTKKKFSLILCLVSTSNSMFLTNTVLQTCFCTMKLIKMKINNIKYIYF